jgi:hypothetical protein
MNMPVRGIVNRSTREAAPSNNMPVRGIVNRSTSEAAPSNPLVHRIICEHSAPNLEWFLAEFQKKDFVIVDEFYPDAATGQYVSHGPIALNYRYIGKIKEWARK